MGMKRLFRRFLFVHPSQVKKGNVHSFFGAQQSAYKNVKDYSQIKTQAQPTDVFPKLVHIMTILFMNTQKLLQK